MKRLILITLLIFGSFVANAQDLSNCKQTCEVEKIIQEGPYLGVKIGTLNGRVLVMKVIENTAAERFGFQKDDYIKSIDGLDMAKASGVKDLILSHKPGDLISVILARGENEEAIDVVIGALNTRIEKTMICCEEENEFLNVVNVSLSPNPTSDLLRVKMQSVKAGKYTIHIFDALGAEAFVSVENIEDSFNKQFDVSAYSAGMYFIKISEGKDVYSTSFVVTK